MIHIHRYQWGEIVEERWKRRIGWNVYEAAPLYQSYVRTAQTGTCRCGKAKLRYLS
jgi:hypothetical protein